MVVALLVLILERTQMIGILKALELLIGRFEKIFYTILFTLFCRGFLGKSNWYFIIVQQQFGIIQLPPENYYVNQAPVYLNWGYILC
jgi:lipoprotein-releasing system permease protein